MAIRERPGRASPFQVYWNNPFTGKRESKSFETIDQAEKHDDYIKYQLKHERDAFYNEEAEEAEDSDLTVESLCFLYLKAKRMSPVNAKKVLSAVDPLLEDIGDISISDLDKSLIKSTIQKQSMEICRPRSKKGKQVAPLARVSPQTIKNRFGILKAVLNWAEEEGIVEHVPNFKLPSPQKAQIPPPTPEECTKIYNVSPPHIQRAIILGLSFGMRIGASELFKLTWNDVDLKRKELRVWSADKNQKIQWRDVPIKESLLPIFEQWKEEDKENGVEHLLTFRGKPLKSGFGKAWHRALEKAEINRRIRPYDLRHAFATESLAGGADIGSVAYLMGHQDKTMILKTYQHPLNRQKKEAVESVPDLPVCAQAHVPKEKGSSS